MPEHLELDQLAAHGTPLAHVDDVTYLDVALILACPANGTPTIYCPRSEWRATPAARLAELLRSNAELQALAEASASEVVRLAARVAELEARETPAQNQAAQFAAQAAYVNGDAPPPINPGPCPECGKTGWKSGPALKMHRQRAHQGLVAHNGKAAQLEPDHGWRCNEPGCTGAFTRSLSSPDYCTRHAPAHTGGNGVLVEQ